MTTLHLYLFGGLRVYYGQDPLPPFPTQKTRSLFAYLVTFRQREHPREILAGTFWGDMPSSQARRNLSTTLWRLRRTLPPGYLQGEGDVVAFDSGADYWLDVATFEQTLQQTGITLGQQPQALGPEHPGIAPLHQAVELYRGDFLQGFYEDWCLVEAERLRSLYLQALHGLLSHHRAGGEYERALDYARQLLAVDSLREDVHQQAMELYELLGRRSDALVQFETCRQLLREELGVEPLPATMVLYGRIRQAGRPHQVATLATPSTHPRPLPRTPFDDFGQVALIGRERERARLGTQIDAAGQGQGGLVLVEGEAGVGKTRLVQEAVRLAKARDWLVLSGTCREMQAPPPYQSWTEALRSGLTGLTRQALAAIPRLWLSEMTHLLPELSQIVPDLPPASPGPLEQKNHIMQALLQFLVGLGQDRPCLVILENIQWADESTLEALRYISPCLQDTPILIIGTARAEELTRHLQEILRGLEGTAALQRLVLGRLSQQQTGQLAGEMLGWPSPRASFTERLYEETLGNPFFVSEVLKELFESKLLARDQTGQWRLAGERTALKEIEWPLPPSIRQTVQRRLERLDKSGLRLLELAAVLGKEIDYDLLWQASNWPEETFLEVTDNLLRRQLLLEIDEQFRFSHDKIQQVIYQGIRPARQRQLHRRSGETLERLSPGRIEDLAHHFFWGRQPEQALPYCLQAGKRAHDLYANQSALTYCGWAIEAAREVGGTDGRCALMNAHERRGHLWEHLGNPAEALVDYAAMREAAQVIGDGAAVARAVRRSAWVRGEQLGAWDEGLRGARQAWKLAEEVGSRREAAIALLDMGFFHNMRGEHAQALDTLQQALNLSEELSDAGAKAASLQYLGIAYQFLCRYSEALAAWREAAQTWEQRGNRRAGSRILGNIGYLQLSMGNLEDAEQAFLRAKASLDEIEAHSMLPWVLVGLGALHRCRGEPAEGQRILEQAQQVDQRVGSSPYYQALILLHRAWVRWDMGQVRPAVGDMRAGLALARQSDTPILVVDILNGLATLLRTLGRPGPARDHYQESLALSGQIASPAGQATARIGLGLIELAQGNEAEGWSHLKQALRLSQPMGARALAESLLAMAEAHLVGGDLKAARALARRALVLNKRMGLRPAQVHNLRLLGQALDGLGRPQEAEQALHQALELADLPGYPVERWRILLALAALQAKPAELQSAGLRRAQARTIVEEILESLEEGGLWEAFHAQAAVRALLGAGPGTPLPEGQIHVRLARLGVPTGRPLRDDERIDVIWTVDAGPAEATLRQREGKVALRRRRILRLLAEARAQGGDPTEADLAKALGVSTRTIRSDVATLREAGRQVRTRGGKRLAISD